MATIRSVQEIISGLLDFYKRAQPNMSVNPGDVARDLFVEAPASALSLIYDELSAVSNKQSIRLTTGSDLDKLALNYGLTRKQATPSTGVGLFTFSSITATINIDKGDTVSANNGLSFSVVNGVSINPSAANFYRSVAAQYATQLSFVGITDQYAVEITLAASAPGSSGNIGTFTLNTVSISGVSNITNAVAFTGGTDQETDASFRNRILSNFSGSSVGTSLGFLNSALAVSGVQDAVVIAPGNPLMVRDGTVSKLNADNTLSVVSEGSGGKVDIYVMGNTLTQNIDTFIYQDKSNRNDPTAAANNFVLGQITGENNLTVNQKRIKDIANGQLPEQPVQNILQVSGSVSGSNFTPATTDSFGRTTGNYKLVKDTGIYAGSPWGFDTFEWTDDQVSFHQDLIKGQPFGQDATTFTGLLQIPQVQQSVSLTNENSTVNPSNRSLIQLLHTPANNITRVYNVNTGERYVITNQNYNNTSPFNTTGLIQISGNTLPSPSDVLQVDYNWIVNYDPFSDYDGLIDTSNIRAVNNNVDWGYASQIKKERVNFVLSNGNNFYIGTVSHPVNTIVSVDQFESIDGSVFQVASGTFVNRLALTISFLANPTTSIESIKLKNNNSELYHTAQNNGSFNSSTQLVGNNLLYQTTVILPTDTIAQVGDFGTLTFNSQNVFTLGANQGSITGNQITIPSSAVNNSSSSNLLMEVNYIAAVGDLFSSGTVGLPTSRLGNGYILNNNLGFNNFSIVNTSRRENQIVQKNLSNQFYVEINAPVADLSLVANGVLSVIRLSDGKELWNADNMGTIDNTSSIVGNYQLILNGFNSPAVADRVLVVYYATDVRRFQPFSFSNTVIGHQISTASQDGATGRLLVPLNDFTSQNNVNFQVINPIDGTIYFNLTDGVLTNQVSSATLSSNTNLGTLANLTNLKVKIFNSNIASNNGVYDITNYNSIINTLTITQSLNHLTTDQIAVVRLLDGKEQWNYGGTIDISNNRLLLPAGISAQPGDQLLVFFFNFINLRHAYTSVIGTTTDQIVNTGTLTINGTTLNKVNNVVFTATASGLQQNAAEAIRTALGLNSTASISSNIKLAKIISLSKVETVSAGNNTVLDTVATYDVINSSLANNLYFADQMLINQHDLNVLDFLLPSTTNNLANAPQIGDKLQITLYYSNDNVSENLSYTRNGSLYTNNRFALINRIFVSSGFNLSQSTKLTATSFTQPALGSRYTVYYNYTAPQQNERITITYNTNSLISTATFAIENSRPVNADVLVKAAIQVELDLTLNIVIADNMQNVSSTVKQNVRNALLAALTSNKLGQTITQTVLINTAQSITGVAQARVVYFNIASNSGTLLSVSAQQNQFFVPNNVIVNSETL